MQDKEEGTLRAFMYNELLSGSTTETEAFFTHLREHGFARLRLDADQVRPVVDMIEQAREFFNMPQFVKDSVCPYQPTMEIGYSHVQKQAKEFFAVRLKPDGEAMETNGAELISDEYQSLAAASLRFLEKTAKDCLTFIARGLQVTPDKLLSLTEEFPLDTSTHSISFMHAFKYTAQAGIALPCPPHTDSGLVTVIPCAENPGLEILDWKGQQWRSVEEEGAQYPTDFVVLIGETLSRLTCSFLQASVHRVRSRPDTTRGKYHPWTRYSLPFQLRGRLDAVIDAEALQSPLIHEVPEPLREKISVRDFIQ